MNRLLAIASLSLLLAAPDAAFAQRVSNRGPRSATAASRVRSALRRAGLRSVRAHVRIRRRPGRWLVTVRVRKGGRTLYVKHLRLRRGRLTPSHARSIADAVRGRLGRSSSRARARARSRRAKRRARRARARARRAKRAAAPRVRTVRVPAGRDSDADADADSDAADEPGASKRTAPARTAAAAPAPPRPAAQSGDRENPLAQPQPRRRAKPAQSKPTAAALGFATARAAAPAAPLSYSPPPAAKRRAAERRARRDAARRRRRRARLARRRARDADADDDDDDADSDDGRTGTRASLRRRGRRRRDRVVLNTAVGFGIGYRRFLWENGKDIAIDWASGAYTQIGAELELYPLQFFSGAPSGLQRLGVRFTYSRSAGLDTELDDGSGAGAQQLNSAISSFFGGLVFRVPRFSNPHAPAFDLVAGFGWDGMSIDDNTKVKSIALTTLVAGLSFTIKVNRWAGIYGLAEYRGVVGAASPMLDAYKAKLGGMHGFRLGGGAAGHIISGVGYRAALSFQRISGTLPLLLDPSQDIRGVDQVVTFVLSLTYEV